MTVNRIRENRTEYRAALNSAMPNVGWNDPAAIPPHGLFNQRHAGVPVTPKTAMQVDTVFTALRVLANGFINMGDAQSFTYGYDPDNRRYKKWDLPQPTVLSNTFGDQYQFDGMTRTVISLALFGEAYWAKLLFDDLGYCTCVEVLNPAFIEVRPNKKDNTKVEYWYGSGVGKVRIPNANLVHIPFMAMPGANRGLSSIEYAGIAMALALAAMEFGSQWFAQGASPSYILSTEQKLGDEEILRIAQKFQVEHSGLKQAHLPLIADSGLKIEKSGSTPDEAQFIGTLDYTRMVLASYFGLPSHLVGSTADKGNVWGKTVQEQGYQMEDFALALDTPIPTPTGWTTMGELCPGDEVFGSDGSATPVLSVSPTHINHDCFRVTFDDGTSIIADAGHRWVIKTRRPNTERSIDGNRWRGVYNTREISESLHDYDGNRFNHRIQLADVLDLPEVDLPVDPYLLGYWLGDGRQDRAQITVDADDLKSLIDQVYAAGYTSKVTPDLNSSAWNVYVSTDVIKVGGQHGNSMTKQLRVMGVLNDKHIPSQYLRASKGQRLALLQGLMDSDGTISGKQSRCEFVNTNHALAEGVNELLCSLGFKPHLAQYQYNYKHTTRVSFAPRTESINPFRLDRKAQRYLVGAQREVKSAGYRTIVSVNPVESVDVKCITVGTEDHLYLAGTSMVPTHNTYSGYTKRLEEVFSFGSVFTPAGHKVSFSSQNMRRGDSAGIAVEIEQERNAGVKTQNDIRIERWEMKPIDGGDQLDVPMNTAPQPPKPPGTPGGPPAAGAAVPAGPTPTPATPAPTTK